MASSNLDLVRSIYTAWERGDFSSTDWADPEIEFVISDGPTAGAWVGVAPMIKSFRGFVGVWEDFRIDAGTFHELDAERVLVLVHFSGRGRTSGFDLGQLATKAAQVFHLRDGAVTRLAVHYDQERVLAELGVAPEADAK
jgi:ketosteroid isomerase-like protein